MTAAPASGSGRATVIEMEGLRKRYRRIRKGEVVALDGLDLSVPEGGVFGFLGPNGAGKTTTVRCLLALVRASAGRCSILGVDPQRGELQRVIDRIGSIVETPAHFPGFSGRRNLELLARTARISGSRVSEVLERVDLAGRADDRVKGYSLGMKQRLGIAAALLKDPELLILDEPANGLDPAGIREVRELLRSLGAEGRTVFVSSHILSEVQQTCDRVAILARGRCVATGGVQEVLSSGGGSGVLVRVGEPGRAAEVLAAAGMTSVAADGRLRVDVAAQDAARISEALARAGLYVSELRPDDQNLESVFLRLTADDAAEPARPGPSDEPGSS
ncbi:ABC transporter ATP-binding protein [soil metagenome]